jgi:hypothetical protein
MGFFRSQPQQPVPWRLLLLSVLVLWIAPIGVGLVGLLIFFLISTVSAEFGLLIWFSATALTFSPLFSWIGWLIALPPVALALRLGWFGWVEALLIGAAAGAVAGGLAEIEAALPFGMGALLVLRAVLGRLLPI